MKFEFARSYKTFIDPLKETLLKREYRFVIFIGCGLALLLAILGIFRVFIEDDEIHKDDDGRIIAIERSATKNKEIPVKTLIKDKDGIHSRNFSLRLKKIRRGRDEKEKNVDDDGEKAIDVAVEQIKRDIESSKDKNIKLPRRLDDNRKIIWIEDKSLGVGRVVMIIIMTPLAILLWDRSKHREERRKYIAQLRWSIPEFTHQVVILMNSGVILSDVFVKLANNYRAKDTQNSLEEIYLRCWEQSILTNRDFVYVFREEAGRSGVKEIIRIAGIVCDAQHTGVDLRRKLENESRILWHDRKKLAEERGRLAESKLAIPLGLLLIVLIILTATPAMMSI